MPQLESQIAKIHLFNAKSASNYVFVLAEKAYGSDAELYMVAELPVFNPAAYIQCEQICLAVAGALKRAYKRPAESNSFENAIAQINEELGKLAEIGQNYWINKFNCVLAVKNYNEFNIATCGKTVAYLLREGQFSDISTATAESHPLKTFDSFASGKIRLGDILILSNNQLLNFLSLDRVREILAKENFLQAAQTVIELLKETAGPETGFGTIFNLQVLPGQTGAQEVDLENYVVNDRGFLFSKDKILAFFKSLLGLHQAKRQNKATLPKTTPVNPSANTDSALKPLKINGGAESISAGGRLAQFMGAGGKILRGAKGAYGDFSGKLKTAGRAVSPAQIKQMSSAKKYLLVSIIIFLVAAGLSITAAVYNKNVKQKKAVIEASLQSAEQNLNLAQSALLYKNETQAKSYFTEAQKNLPGEKEVFKEQVAHYQKIMSQFEEFKLQIEHKTLVNPENLGSLAQGDRLLALRDFLAVQSGKNIISFEKSTSKIEDGRLKTNLEIKAAYGFAPGQAVVYNGESLAIWSFAENITGPAFISSVPPGDKFAGLAFYPTNNRAYLIDTQKNQIISFLINKDKLQKPVVAINDAVLKKAQDIAIDGNVYVLTDNGILKFAAGRPSPFEMPFLFEPFSGHGRIYTEIGWQNLYLLDFAKKRIIIMDKKGNLVKILASEKFNDLKDFAVEENQMTIYVLNGTNLLKINY